MKAISRREVITLASAVAAVGNSILGTFLMMDTKNRRAMYAILSQ